MDAFAASIVAKIAAHSQGAAGPITEETVLSALEIHSIELAEVIFDIEDEFGIEIEMNTAEAWSQLVTVGDVVAAVRAIVGERS